MDNYWYIFNDAWTLECKKKKLHISYTALLISTSAVPTKLLAPAMFLLSSVQK